MYAVENDPQIYSRYSYEPFFGFEMKLDEG